MILKLIGLLPRGGGHSAHTHTGGSVQEIFRQPKISLQLHCNPKISAHFTLRKLCMNIKYPETMQIEVRIASKHRNIISTIFDLKKYHELNFNSIWTQKYHFGNILTQKYGTYLPVCALLSAPPWGLLFCQNPKLRCKS